MERKKIKPVFIFLVIVVLIGITTIVMRMLMDENKFTVQERSYITSSKSKLIDVKILNDANIFASAGKGVYYDYLQSFEKTFNLSFNKIAITDNTDTTGLTMTKGQSVPNEARVFYVDHFVLVSKKFTNINSMDDVKDKVGVLNRDLNLMGNYAIKNSEYKVYENRTDLENAFNNGTVGYIAVPMVEYLDYILSNLYSIVYHMSDAKDYYYMSASDNKVLTSILSKYYNVWSKENFNDSFNKNEYNLFINKLKLTEKELTIIDSKTYNYAFIETPPYDAKIHGTYGGIMAEYLKNFSEFSDTQVNYKEYYNLDKLKKDIGLGNVDIYVDYYGINSLTNIDTPYNVTLSVVMSNKDSRAYTSLASLKGNTVYIKENSKYSDYLQGIGISVSTYKNNKEIKKLLDKNSIIIMDELEYLIYSRENHTALERFKTPTNIIYSFKSNNDSMFNRLFTYYVSTLDINSLKYNGIASYDYAIEGGKWITRITEYAVILIAGISITAFFSYKLGKKVHIKRKIKKTDKMKYIDVLTSLKNRNFLTESIPIWNQNTIYPQAIILINLNGVQELNDAFGYTEGDKQIQAFANVLIKTQLDNTEIMRTDGNEFVIYMLGYNEKQVLSYIKKLNKEIKTLPYDKGAAIGFSMIEDDVKLIDDAINEATEIMKKNKPILGEEDEEQI